MVDWNDPNSGISMDYPAWEPAGARSPAQTVVDGALLYQDRFARTEIAISNATKIVAAEIGTNALVGLATEDLQDIVGEWSEFYLALFADTIESQVEPTGSTPYFNPPDVQVEVNPATHVERDVLAYQMASILVGLIDWGLGNALYFESSGLVEVGPVPPEKAEVLHALNNRAEELVKQWKA